MYSLKIGSGQCLLSQCPHYWRIKIQGDSCAPKIDLIEHRTRLRSLFDPCLGGSPLQDCERERERAGGVAWAALGRTLLLCRRSRLHGGNVHQQHLTFTLSWMWFNQVRKMNNIGLEVVFWTALSIYLLAKLGVFKKWSITYMTIKKDIKELLTQSKN